MRPKITLGCKEISSSESVCQVPGFNLGTSGVVSVESFEVNRETGDWNIHIVR